MKVRQAEVDDAEEILEIYKPYVENTAVTFEYTPPSIDEMENRIKERKGKYPFLVLEDGDRILGYAYLSPFKERDAYNWSAETSIYLRLDQIRRGLGTIMLEVLEEEARKMNLLSLDACIAIPRGKTEYLTLESMKFHEKKGYKTVAHFPSSGYKFGEWFDMIWMEKELGEHTSTPKDVVWYGDVKNRI